MRNPRTLQQAQHARHEADLVTTRIGEQALRNMETLIRGLLFAGSGKDAIITEGLVASSGGGMVVNLTAPAAVVQMIDGGDVRFAMDFNAGSNFAVTLANGDAGGARIDIIEAQVARRNAYTDTTVYQINPSNKSLTQGTASRDKHIYINVRKKDGVVSAGVAPAVTPATAGILTSTVIINPNIDLSVRYMLAIAVGIDAEFVEVDCRGAAPAATTIAEIIANLNAAGFGTIAANDGSDHIRITAPGTGENSLIRIKQPTTSSLDAYSIIMGGTMGDNYCDAFAGTNKWFKLSEINVPQNAVAITGANIKTIHDQGAWTLNAESVHVARSLENVNPLRGQITGGLQFRDATHAPYICPGSYDISDTQVNIAALTDSGANGFIGDQTKRARYWYYVMMNRSGSVALQLAEGAYIGKTYNITSISGGNTINFSGSAGGTQPAAGQIAVLEGLTASGEVGFWPIASVGGGGTVTSIVVSGTLTNQAGAGGTVKVYHPVSTFHTGVSTGYGSAAFTEWSIDDLGYSYTFTPSPADALFSTPVVRDWAWYDPARNGYYSKFTGYTHYRILGCVYVDATPNYADVISYKTGRNKNDNCTVGNQLASNLFTASNVIYHMDLGNHTERVWGNDYMIADDSTDGFRVKILRECRIASSWPMVNTEVNASSHATRYYLRKNGTCNGDMFMFVFTTTDNFGTDLFSAIPYHEILKPNDILDVVYNGDNDGYNLRFPHIILTL